QADTAVARIVRHAQHVGPLRQPAVLDRRDRVYEPLHRPPLVERAEQNAAAFDRDEEHRRRDDVFGIGVTPDAPLQGRYVTAVVERRQLAYLHSSPSEPRTPRPYPGGHCIPRPASTCRWMWNTV